MDRDAARALLIAAGTDPDWFDASDRWAFLTACKDGPTAQVEAFLVAGMPMHDAADREPPIIKAAEGGSLERIDLLLAHGASLDELDASGDTALQTAANWDNVDLLKALLTRGGSPNTANHKQWTPLSQAVHKGKTGVIEALLEAGADPNFAGGTSRPIAFALGDTQLLKRLLAAGAEPEGTRQPLLRTAAVQKKAAAVSLLLAHGAKDVPNAHGWNAAMLATVLADADTIKAFGDAPIDGTLIAGHALIAAAKQGNTADLAALLADGHPIDFRDEGGMTPLLWAAASKQAGACTWLLNAGADASAVSDGGAAAVTFAARDHDLELLETLLAAGAPADERKGKSQALILASSGPLAVVKRLLTAGATVDSVDTHGQTPAYIAASRNLTETLALLLEAGASPHGSGNGTHVPILMAAPKGNTACVGLLLEAGATVDHRDHSSDETPLLKVCRNKEAALAATAVLLVDHGADPAAHNKYGASTALSTARSSGNTALVEALTERLTTGWLARFQTGGDFDAAGAVAAVAPEVLTALVEAELDLWVLRLLAAGLDPVRLTTGPRPPLFVALARPDAALAHAMLDAGADPHATRRGDTTLMIAAGASHLDLVERLIALGVEPTAVATPYNSTALTRAAGTGVVAVMAALVGAGAPVDPFRAGSSPLLLAASGGHEQAVQWLLDRGADPALCNRSRETALDLARRHKHEGIAALLADRTPIDFQDKAGTTPLLRAALAGDVFAVQNLLAQGADTDKMDASGRTPRTVAKYRANVAPLFDVAYQPHQPAPLPAAPPAFRAFHRGTLRELAGLNLDETDFRGDTLLHHACRRGLADWVRALLDAGASPALRNKADETPWALAAVHGRAGIDDIVRERGGKRDVNDQAQVLLNHDPFADAMRIGNLAWMAELLQQAKVPLDAWSPRHTPLTTAVERKDAEMVSLLLAHGADTEAVGRFGTPLCDAARNSAETCARALLKGGAEPSPEALPPGQAGPLQLAAEAGNEAIMTLLLDAGAPAEIDVERLYRDEARTAVRAVGRARALAGWANA